MSNRYQKEIEEILKNAGESAPKPAPKEPKDPGERPTERRPRRRPSLPRVQKGDVRRAAISYKPVILAGIIVLLINIFVGGLPLFFTGAGLLVAGYVIYYRTPRSRSGGRSNSSSGGGNEGGPPKMWRGRPISPDDDPHFTGDRWGTGRR